MKRLFAILSVLLFAATALAPATFNGKATFNSKATINGVSGGGGGSSFSDNFNRANSGTLGANWTQPTTGKIQIIGNEANTDVTFDLNDWAAAYTATACSTVSQYVKVTFPASGGAISRPGVLFRYTDGSSPYYELRADSANNRFYWISLSAANGTETLIEYQAQTITFPLTIGLTCTGTGNSTVVRVWLSPSANAPDAGGTTWDSAGAGFTFTSDPTTAANTGLYVGLGGIGSNGMSYDNFFGGDVP